jgi:hypothetical protein
MSRPTKAAMLQTREDVIYALGIVSPYLPLGNPAVDRSWAEIESFIAVAMRVFAKTNTSKLRSETTTVELAARLAGRVVFDPD